MNNYYLYIYVIYFLLSYDRIQTNDRVGVMRFSVRGWDVASERNVLLIRLRYGVASAVIKDSSFFGERFFCRYPKKGGEKYDEKISIHFFISRSFDYFN